MNDDEIKKRYRYNKGMNGNNTTGFKGVTFNRVRGKYVARFRLNDSRKFLGYFSTAQEAADVRDEHVRKTLGANSSERDPAFIRDQT